MNSQIVLTGFEKDLWTPGIALDINDPMSKAIVPELLTDGSLRVMNWGDVPNAGALVTHKTDFPVGAETMPEVELYTEVWFEPDDLLITRCVELDIKAAIVGAVGGVAKLNVADLSCQCNRSLKGMWQTDDANFKWLSSGYVSDIVPSMWNTISIRSRVNWALGTAGIYSICHNNDKPYAVTTPPNSLQSTTWARVLGLQYQTCLFKAGTVRPKYRNTRVTFANAIA